MKVSKSLAFILFLTIAGCGSSEETVSDYIESGNKYFADGNFDKARIEYKNALQIDPRQAEPYYKMALIDEKNKNWKGMFANLNVVEQLNPNHVDALIKLGNFYVIGGDYEKAMVRAEKALGLQPENLEAKNLKASIYLKQEKYDEATVLLSDILSKDAENLTALSMQAAKANQLGNYDEALSKLDETIALYPDEMSLQVMKLSIMEKQKNYADMPAVYEELIKQNPDSWELLTSYTQLLNNALGKYDESIAVLDKFIEAHPKDTQAKLTQLSLIKTKDPEQALAKLEGYLLAEPDNYDFRFLKVANLMEGNEKELAQNELENILKDDPEGVSGNKARTYLARLAASEGDFEKAERLVQEVLKTAADDSDALTLMAKLNLRKENVDAAITQLRTVLRNSPESDEAHVLLAQAYAKSGSVELSEQSFRQALDVNPYNKIAALAVTRRLLTANDYERAAQVVSTALQRNTDDIELTQLLAQIKIVQKDWSAAKAALNSLMAVDESAQTHNLLGLMYQGQGDFGNAVNEFKLALTMQPTLIPALRGLTISYEQLKQRDQLESYLIQFTNDNPDVLAAKQVLAKLHSENGNWNQAFDLLEAAVDKNKTWVAGYVQLATLYDKNQQSEAVVVTYKKAIDANPDNQVLKTQLASYYEKLGNYAEARTLYEAILEKDPELDVVANNLASILTDQYGEHANLQKALELSEKFASSTQPYFIDTYGWVNLKLGDLEKAKPAIEKAVELAPNVPIFAYHLAVLYTKLADVSADEKIRKARELANKENEQELLEKLKELD